MCDRQNMPFDFCFYEGNDLSLKFVNRKRYGKVICVQAKCNVFSNNSNVSIRRKPPTMIRDAISHYDGEWEHIHTVCPGSSDPT